MPTRAPDPFDEALAGVLADEELMAHVDELHRRLRAGELEIHTHEEVLERLRRFGVRRPLADGVDHGDS
ncbi:MAG: hypothetical protein ACREQ5_34480 [Candidatus Dormibacteria bacterium]